MTDEKKKGRPSKVDDSFINLCEKFDQHKLNHMIANKDMFPMRVFDADYNPFAIAGKYLAKSKNGLIKTKYKQNNSFGRFHALGSLSLQSIPREIRHTISKDYYNDIDIKNAHPVILSFMCAERGISCKYLNRYNSKRDEFLADISSDKEQAKTVVLSMINGGKSAMNAIANPPVWLNKFKKELKTIHTHFANDAEFKAHKKKRVENEINYNHEASYMNTLLCDFENKILQTMYRSIGSPKDCVLCFDGIMIRKEQTYDLAKLEASVKTALNIDISLAVKEMNQGFDIVAEPYVDASYNSFDFTDPYNYNDFHTEFNNVTYDSHEELESALIGYPKVIAHVLQGEGFFIKKLENGELDIVKRLRTSDFRVGSPKLRSFEQYLCDKTAFGQIACELETCPDNKFNIWTGFQAKRVSVSESDGFKLMKSFIMESWANNDEVNYNYIISWFAGLVVNLGSINKVALAMISGQGTGKGTFIEFMDLILRSVNSVSTTGIQSITGRFNTILQGKRLVNINEMSSTKDEFKSNFDKIKSYITDPTIVIEPKGVNAYSIKNISNFVLFTNHRDAIIVEETDRRYAIFEMSGVHMNDDDYFGNIRKTCFNQDVANEFYTYLLDFPAVPLSKIPETTLRQEMMNMSKSSPLKFLDAVKEENLFEGEVKSSVLYDAYRNWCANNGERLVLTSTKFGSIISTKLQKLKSRDGNYYVL